MSYQLLQNQTARPLVFLMVDEADHITGKTGLSPTVTLSKDGGSFGSPSGAVTEIGNGWYKVAGNATDANTLGPLILHATATGADPVDVVYDVVANDPETALNNLSAAQVNAEVDAALADIHLDHLLAADYDPANKPGVATALLNELVESDGGVSRYTANALEQAQAAAAAALTAYDPPTHAELTTGLGALNDLSAAEVNAAVDTALADYDPPTNAELTARTLAAASYATAANQTTILDRLGAFAGSGVNTVLGFLRGLLRSDVAAPSDVGGTYDPATDSLEALRQRGDAGWTGLDAAGTRAAVGLAAANLDTQLSGINSKTTNLPSDPADQSAVEAAVTAAQAAVQADIAALNDLTAAQVNAEVDAALADIHLDHLLAADYDPANKPGVATALLNELVENDGGVSRYTANALEQAPAGGGGGGGATAAEIWAHTPRTLTQTAAEIAAAVAGSDLTLHRGDTWSASLTGLGSVAGRLALWFTAKRRSGQTDAEAAVQMTEADGLVVLNGAAGDEPDGAIAVDDEDAGDVTLTLAAAAGAQLAPGPYVYDLQWRDAAGGIHTLAAGALTVVADVTRAT